MAEPLVAPSVVRYTINGDVGGRPVANILDVVLSGLSGVDRDDLVVTTAGKVLREFNDGILDRITSSYQARSVSWVDLDSEDGTTGEITGSEGTNWPSNGGRNGAVASANVAILVTKFANSSRGKRNGRWFLPPPSEADTAGNRLENAYQQTLQAGLDQFLEQMTETGIASPFQRFPTVVHTRNVGTPTAPVYEYTGNTQIQEMLAQALLATQRRRLRP